MSQNKTTNPSEGAASRNPTPEEIERAALQMLAHDAAGSDDASVTNAQKICDIIIVDLNNREIPIKTLQYELLFELREYLNAHIFTFFFTNFTFEHNGVALNEYTELSELDLVT